MFKKEDISISEISTYSFSVYFIFVLVGLVIDLAFFSQKILPPNHSTYIGFGIITLSTIVIYWARGTGKNYRKNSHRYNELEHENLKKGAFKFTRNPHYIGVGTLFLGLSIVMNSLAILVLATLSFIVVNAWFIPHEELILEERHGKHFKKYKDTTRRWF
ncbi:MAG: protein-S-isoprenylcysteine O-methyltransferase Ste14 [Candidatus Paceibacteria bacterium]|jgi:protein-S-isoprenylcysteine O-methyltransferase Ste14